MKKIRFSIINTLFVLVFALLCFSSFVFLHSYEYAYAKSDGYKQESKTYKLNTEIVNPPNIVLECNSSQDLELLSKKKKPSIAMLNINKDLEVVSKDNKKLITLDEFVSSYKTNIIPAVYIDAKGEAEALADKLNQENAVDMYIISANKEFISIARGYNNTLMTVLDLSDSSETDLAKIVALTNESNCKNVILPGNLVNKNNVEFLQKRVINIWARSNATQNDIHNKLFSGANSLICENTDTAIEYIESFLEKTLVRKPFVIGHRGLPSDVPENSIKGAEMAVEVGADIIETDLRLTLDNEIVLVHDDTIDRVVSGESGKVSDFTLEQLRTFSIGNDKYPDLKIPTFKEYLKTFKGKEVVIFAEIKDSSPEIIPLIKAQIEEESMQGQIVLISFFKEQLVRCRESMPGISSGFLIDKGSYDVLFQTSTQSLLEALLPNNLSYHPQYTCINESFMNFANERGIAYYTWTYGTKNAMLEHYVDGFNGLTTNSAYYIKNFITKFNVKSTTLENNQIFPVELLQADGKVSETLFSLQVLTDGFDVKIDNGVLKSNKTGSVDIILKATQNIGEDSYNIYSEIITLSILDEETADNNALVITLIIIFSVLIVAVCAVFVIVKVKKKRKSKNK